MYNKTAVQNAFMGMVGLRQTNNPDFDKLSDLITFDGENQLIQHSLLNIENLDMTSRNYSAYNYPDFNIVSTYSKGDRIKFNEELYESLVNVNTGSQPDTNPSEWEKISLLSLYLEDIFRSAIDETVQEVFLKKKINKLSKSLLQNQRLSYTTGGFNDRVINEDDLVGVEFTLKNRNNIKAVINQIGIQLTGAQDFNFYLYHSSQLEPVQIIPVSYTKNGSLEWMQVDIQMNNLDDVFDSGGVFYLMYNQSELGVQALQKKHNWHKPPCSYCNANEITSYNLYSKYISMRTVRVASADRNEDDDLNLWDLQKTKYVSDNNFGLNFEWTIKCDITSFIIKQKDTFAYAVRDMTIKKLLESMANSTRQNGLDEKVRLMARSELQDKSIGGMGWNEKIEKQLWGVDFEMSRLDATCMPCGNKTGLRINTAGLSYGR